MFASQKKILMEISFKNIEHIVYGSDRRKESERFTSPQRWFIFAGSPGARCVAFKPFILFHASFLERLFAYI